jgi:hypothetical protein
MKLVRRILDPAHRSLIAMSWLATLLALPIAAQIATPPPPQTPFAALIAEYLRRDANGHSPAPEEIAAMAELKPAPDPASIREAMPYLLKCLESSDKALHAFGLATIQGLQTQPAATPEAQAPPTTEATPAAYKPEVAKVLAPFLAPIATHLASEEAAPNRLLTVQILEGFRPDPPAAVYPPLFAYLKRDDAVSPVGFAVVSALIQLGPLSDDAVAAIGRYLRRPDQTTDTRADLTDLIATRPNQSQALNKTLLLYLDSDDNALRARVILSLPQLDLAAGLYNDTKYRVEQLAANPNENLQVVSAAKSVAPCWTSTKMATGCPVYQ